MIKFLMNNTVINIVNERVDVRINHHIYNFSTEITIFQACLIHRIFLPRFCYHVASQIAGNCRMCLVEEKSSLKLVASCAVSIEEGQLIHTDTEVIKKAREGVLEYLLINHPLDCPICDQGGECDLQDQTMVFGADRGRFYEDKRTTPNKNFGFLIKTFLNRCIHCSRCTRFLSELAGTSDIQLLGRGLKTEIGSYVDNFIKSEISGNILDLCPVGALTSKPYAFRARLWELNNFYSFDLTDGFGASIQVDFRGIEIMRILPKSNNFLNEEWISDKARFIYDSFTIQRLDSIYLKKISNKFIYKLNWVRFFRVLRNWVLSIYNHTKYSVGRSILLEHGNFGTLDDVFATKYFRNMLNLNYLSSFSNYKFRRNVDFRKFYGIQDMNFLDFNHKDAEKMDIFNINVNLRFESPILNLKVRRMWFNEETYIFHHGFLSNQNFEFIHCGLLPLKSFFNKTIVGLCCGFSNENYSTIQKNISPITSSLSNMAICELNMQNKNYFSNIDYSINSGFFEFSKNIFQYFFSLNIMHHVEDSFTDDLISYNNFLLPTSFYYEKISNYVNNTFNFFNTTYHFSLKIPESKEDYKIFLGLFEILSSLRFSRKDFKNKFNDFFIPFFNGRINNLNFITTNFVIPQYVYKFNYKSLYNDFFDTNILCRISSVLSLHAKTFFIANDFVFGEFRI